MIDEELQYHSANFPQFKRDKNEKFDKGLAKTAIIFDNKEDWLEWLGTQDLKRSFSLNEHNVNMLHIHIPKTGGMSMKSYVYGDTQHYNNFGHNTAWRLREWFKNNGNEEEWNNYYKFAVVRNPWDILWSGYKYTKFGSKDVKAKSKTPNLLPPYNPTQIVKKVDDKEVLEHHRRNVMALRAKNNNNQIANSFKEYVEAIYNSKMVNPYSGRLISMYNEETGKKDYMNMPFTTFQFPYIIDYKTEEILVDHIGKFEDLKETVYHLAKITKDNNIIHSFNLSSKNVSSTEVHYKNMYDDDMINMVGEIYKEDILRFNYDF
jgi:hypothetical protein